MDNRVKTIAICSCKPPCRLPFYENAPSKPEVKEIPHNKGGWLASEFSVRRACKFHRFAGGKSRNLQDVHGNGTARYAARLYGISLKHRDTKALMYEDFDNLFFADTCELQQNRGLVSTDFLVFSERKTGEVTIHPLTKTGDEKAEYYTVFDKEPDKSLWWGAGA